MKCKEFNGKVSRLARGELDGAEREACLAHAGGCGRCAKILDEMRRAEDAVRRLAAGDAARAEAALAGFEARVLERRRRERRVAALGDRPERRPWALRWALGLSLAVNACAMIVFGVGNWGAWGPRGGAGRDREAAAGTVHYLPAGLPQAEQMRHVYGELEELFGNRLGWVAQSGGEVSMGVISDPDAARPVGSGQAEPLVALVYWMDAEGNGAEKRGGPVVILTRAGRGGEIRQQAPLGPGRTPVEIAVESFRARRGGFAIQTRVRPVAAGGGTAAEAVSSLAAEMSLRPGEPAKLGEVRMGDQMVRTFLAVQVLGNVGKAGEKVL